MDMSRSSSFILSLLLGIYHPFCTAAVRPTVPPDQASMAELWQRPDDIERRDLFNGPWGKEHAPDPNAVYSIVERKEHGTNPGITVKDQLCREWPGNQPPNNNMGAQGQMKVTMALSSQ